MSTRTSGVLLHPTSLPGRYGIGDLGDEAYAFVDFLADARQGVWQVLPLGPTGYGDSPYQCFSAFAGNPLLVSPDRLVAVGLLDKRDVKHVPRFSHERVEYGRVIEFKKELLRRAFEAFVTGAGEELRADYVAFRRSASSWLDVYALFRTLKEARGGASWNEWERPLAMCDPAAIASAVETLAREIEAVTFAQYLFFSQWRDLRVYCNARGIRILGDAPIFVAYDSADVWANRELFKLDENGAPIVVAGVPPDYFSVTGQLWGNPIYDWRRMEQTGFAWWIERLRAGLGVFDMLRLDHFRGFAACWEVPATESTAINGAWVTVPGAELFEAVHAALGPIPIIAEDLGLITPDVEALREALGFPGMRVLQFAFGGGTDSVHLPHNHVPNSVVYTGTHDNETTVGWYRDAKGRAARRERAFCRDYFGIDSHDIHWSFVRAAFASVSRMAIVPMQDLLGLGSEARMNLPSSASGNWDWRMPTKALTAKLCHKLLHFTELYGRAVPANPSSEDA
jgi:4-alpha-glucanotransferase